MTSQECKRMADEVRQSITEACKIFVQLTGASYYGFHFREVLATDPEAFEAAKVLVARLREAGVRGMD